MCVRLWFLGDFFIRLFKKDAVGCSYDIRPDIIMESSGDGGDGMVLGMVQRLNRS